MSEGTNFSQSTFSDKRQVLLDTFRQVPLFAHLPDEQLQWLSEQGTEIQLRPGAQIACQGVQDMTTPQGDKRARV